MKIKWESVPPYIVWNRIKALRKKMGLNQTQVAAGADISIATLFNIEHGYEETTTMETKEKLAKFFECNVDDIFPAEMMGMISFEEWKEKCRYEQDRHLLLTLYDFIPDLHFKDEENAAAILKAMTQEELGPLFSSGLIKDEALEHLRKAAKKYNLVEPEIK